MLKGQKKINVLVLGPKIQNIIEQAGTYFIFIFIAWFVKDNDSIFLPSLKLGNCDIPYFINYYNNIHQCCSFWANEPEPENQYISFLGILKMFWQSEHGVWTVVFLGFILN